MPLDLFPLLTAPSIMAQVGNLDNPNAFNTLFWDAMEQK
jgi:hypothetical protein